MIQIVILFSVIGCIFGGNLRESEVCEDKDDTCHFGLKCDGVCVEDLEASLCHRVYSLYLRQFSNKF